VKPSDYTRTCFGNVPPNRRAHLSRLGNDAVQLLAPPELERGVERHMHRSVSLSDSWRTDRSITVGRHRIASTRRLAHVGCTRPALWALHLVMRLQNFQERSLVLRLKLQSAARTRGDCPLRCGLASPGSPSATSVRFCNSSERRVNVQASSGPRRLAARAAGRPPAHVQM
jgi:hypothetical protein